MDGHSRGECCNDWLADELDEEAKVEEPTQDFYDPSEKGQSDSLVRGPPGIVEGHEGVDSGGPYGGLSGGAQEAVGEAGHKAGIQPVLQGQSGQGGVPCSRRYASRFTR